MTLVSDIRIACGSDARAARAAARPCGCWFRARRRGCGKRYRRSFLRSVTFLNILQPEESLAVMMADSRGHADTWGTIARTCIRLTGGWSLPVAMQDRLIAEADALTPDNPYDVFTLATSHTGFLLQPAEVAGILDQHRYQELGACASQRASRSVCSLAA